MFTGKWPNDKSVNSIYERKELIMDIEKKVIECAALVYEVDESEITLETDIREDLSAQSIKLIGFVGGLEDAFGIVIDFSNAIDLVTIKDFVDKVKEQIG